MASRAMVTYPYGAEMAMHCETHVVGQTDRVLGGPSVHLSLVARQDIVSAAFGEWESKGHLPFKFKMVHEPQEYIDRLNSMP